MHLVSAVGALLQSVLLHDRMPARARVVVCLIVLSCLLFGSRLLARWLGLRCFILWFLYWSVWLLCYCPGPGGCAFGYCWFVCAFGLAGNFPLPLLSGVPRCPFPCWLVSVPCALMDLFLNALLPLGVSTWCVLDWFFHSMAQGIHHVQWTLLGVCGR